MLEFKCIHCGASITVTDDQRSKAVNCLTCNTRQRVPDNATPIPGLEALQAASRHERIAQPPRAPDYPLANIVGVCLILAGFIQCGVSLVLTFAISPAMLVGLITGLLTLAAGSALHILRESAIDLWHLRQKQ